MAKIKIPLKTSEPKPPRKGADSSGLGISSKGRTPLFDQLFPCSWRGIQFPVLNMRVSLKQDLAEHKYWGKDGANVEATGRAPFEIEAVIPFVNGIVPGKNERWGILYPTEFLKFLQAFNDHKTGILDTPEIAGISCKPVSLDFAHDAQRRDGVEVTARWIETFDLDTPSDNKFSPVDVANLAALNLDAKLASVRPYADPPQFEETFESLVSRLSGVLDTGASKLTILSNKPDQILFRLNKVKDSIERAKNALTWPIEESIHKLKLAAHDAKRIPEATSTTPKRRKTRRHVVQVKTSLTVLAGLFPTNSIDDLIELNPRLLTRPTVPAGSVLRYYAN